MNKKLFFILIFISILILISLLKYKQNTINEQNPTSEKIITNNLNNLDDIDGGLDLNLLKKVLNKN